MQAFYHFGSKHTVRRHMAALLLPMLKDAEEYREPFVGAGAVALSVLSRYPQLPCWINDRDPAIAALWRAIKEFPGKIISRVRAFDPNVPDFRQFSAAINATDTIPEIPDEMIDLGFQQLALSHMRWSAKGSGPRGGYQQQYSRIGERWSPDYLADKLKAISRRTAHTRISSLDFAPLIEDTSKRAVLFLDPPYFVTGRTYHYGFGLADHQRLADLLQQTPHPWVLTYSDCPEVRRLYSWATIVSARYDPDTVVIRSTS